MRTLRLSQAFALVLAIAAVTLVRAVESPSIPADDDERDYQMARNRQVLRDNCLICHSEEMIAASRLTPAQWKAEVEKMVGWGAPLAKEQQQPLIEFLSNQYTPETPPAKLTRMSYLQALTLVAPELPVEEREQGDPVPGARLYAENCANCHGLNARGAELGPNLVEKPYLLRPTEYTEVVRKGRRRMPGFQTALKPEQELDLLAWLRQQRYDAK